MVTIRRWSTISSGLTKQVSLMIRGIYVPSFRTTNPEFTDKKSTFDKKIAIFDQYSQWDKGNLQIKSPQITRATCIWNSIRHESMRALCCRCLKINQMRETSLYLMIDTGCKSCPLKPSPPPNHFRLALLHRGHSNNTRVKSHNSRLL
jgi:hypothetical protein